MSEKDQGPSRSTTTGEPGSQEPFLRRWARLKADAEKERGESEPEAKAPEAMPAEGGSPEGATAPDAESASAAETPPPGDDELPPLETLDENSDYSAFMSPRVSEAMRKQALRKLFRSSKFNYICELDDYIDDYTSFPALGDMITADMKHAAERLLAKQLEADEAQAAENADTDAAADDAPAAGAAAAAGDDPGQERARDQGKAAATPGEDPGLTDANEDTERDA